MKYNSNEKNSENSISVEINGIGKMNNRPLLNEIKNNSNSSKNLNSYQKYPHTHIY